jgi:hypothetical protein
MKNEMPTKVAEAQLSNDRQRKTKILTKIKNCLTPRSKSRQMKNVSSTNKAAGFLKD